MYTLQNGLLTNWESFTLIGVWKRILKKLGDISNDLSKIVKKAISHIFFQILWKSKCHILFTFSSHFKKICSVEWIEDFFSQVTHMKKHQKTILLAENSVNNNIPENPKFELVTYNDSPYH